MLPKSNFLSCAPEIYDRDFVKTWCEGFDRLEAHIRPYTPEWAENITGIPAGDIRSLAVEYASTPRACIRISEAPQKGDLKSFAIPILMAITGHLDRPGGNVYFYPAGRLGFETLGKRIPDSVRNKILGSEKTYVRERGMKGADFQSTVHALLTGEPYRPRASLMFGSNPMSTARNPALVAEALKKIEFSVVVDVALTPTARLADLILPAATRYECEWIPNLWGNHLTMSNRVIEPLWETRNELRMVLDLACRLGMEEDFWQGVLHQSSNPNFLFDWKLRDGDSSDISKNTLVTIRKGSPPSEEPRVEEVA